MTRRRLRGLASCLPPLGQAAAVRRAMQTSLASSAWPARPDERAAADAAADAVGVEDSNPYRRPDPTL